MSTDGCAQVFLAEAIKKAGITHLFGVPAAFTKALNLADDSGVCVISAHSEAAAACMADGYARAARAIGLCYAQNVGGAGLASGLRDAFLVGSPVIALTGGGDGATAYKFAYQDSDDMRMFDAVTKLNISVRRVERFPDLLRLAARTATSGAPGPVHVEVEGAAGQLLDQHLPAEFWDLSAIADHSAPRHRTPGEADAVSRAVDLVAGAQRPILIAGGGARVSDAGPALLEFARAFGAPIVTSMNAKGIIDERDPLACGVVGSYSRDSANRAVLDADVVIFAGSRAGGHVTNRWNLPAPSAKIIQIDIDAQVMGRNFPTAVSIVGDVKTVLHQMLCAYKESGRPPRPAHADWLRVAAAYAEASRRKIETSGRTHRTPIRPEQLCTELNASLSDDCLLVADTGHAGWWTASLMDLKPSQSYLRAAGTLGWSLPAAIGAQCAFPARKVVCFIGDGGFFYYLSELETAVRYELPVVFVVNNNSGFAQEDALFHSGSGRPQEDPGRRFLEFAATDISGLARSFGCAGYCVERPQDLREILQEALHCGRPAVVEVLTDRSAVPAAAVGWPAPNGRQRPS